MSKTVMLPVPVPEEVAASLRDDPARLALLGDYAARLARPPVRPEVDALFDYLAKLPRDPDAPMLTEEEIEAEIDAARAERRR